MTPSVDLRGVIPVLPTPFRPDEAIDPAGLAPLIDFALQAGASAVCLPAYASEFYKLSEAERFTLVQAAVAAAAGRIPVIAQSNHPAARVAAEIAQRNADLGANVISFAIPRLFGLSAPDLLDYCATICRAVNLPILVQDFNPSGATVDAEFCRRLAEECPNFRYIKLEESLMGAKVRAIRAATADRVGVLEGWGGLYMLEVLESGIVGIMPGLGVADILGRVWTLGTTGQTDAAHDLFEKVMPQIAFGLQNLELFLHVEKRLLVQRGLLADATVRRATLTPAPDLLAYGDLLNARVLRVASALR